MVPVCLWLKLSSGNQESNETKFQLQKKKQISAIIIVVNCFGIKEEHRNFFNGTEQGATRRKRNLKSLENFFFGV